MEIPQVELNILSRPLITKALKYFQDKRVQQDYEQWHLKEYGEYPTTASYMDEAASRRAKRKNAQLRDLRKEQPT